MVSGPWGPLLNDADHARPRLAISHWGHKPRVGHCSPFYASYWWGASKTSWLLIPAVRCGDHSKFQRKSITPKMPRKIKKTTKHEKLLGKHK